MESLPQALIDINDAVTAVEKRRMLFENETMKCYVWRMYSQIFAFLTEVVKWYTKRSIQRLYDSLNENLTDFFDDQVEEIRKTARLIHDDAELRTQVDIQVSRLYIEEMNSKMDRLYLKLTENDKRRHLQEQERMEMFARVIGEKRQVVFADHTQLKNIMASFCETIRLQETGSAMAEILENDVGRQRIRSPSLPSSPVRAMHESPKQLRLLDHSVGEDTGSSMSRDQLLEYSADLEDFFDRDKVVLPANHEETGYYVDSGVSPHLQSWITTTESALLYTASMEAEYEPNVLTHAAAQYCQLAREAGLPLCSFSCSLSDAEPPNGRTRETIELVALVYSLIRQLIEILPVDRINRSPSLQDSSFKCLEGTLHTFDEALDILEALLTSTGQPIVVIVINGIELLDDISHESTAYYLEKLINLLKKYVEDEAVKCILKIWFVSGGISQALLENLATDQIVLCEQSLGRSARYGGSTDLLTM